MARGIALNRNRKVPAEETPAFGAIAERFRRGGDLERAVALCQEGLQRFPNNLSARVTLGWALLDLGRYDEAREALESVLKRAPDNLAAIRGLAELHDRAEHTMMLPMDGPGQWPPPVDQDDAAELAGSTSVVPAEPAAIADELEFPPPMTMPIPTATRAVELDPEIPAEIVARAADAVAEAPMAAPPVASEPEEIAPAPVAVSSGVDEPLFLSSSGAPLSVSTEVPDVDQPVATAGVVDEPVAASSAAMTGVDNGPAIELASLLDRAPAEPAPVESAFAVDAAVDAPMPAAADAASIGLEAGGELDVAAEPATELPALDLNVASVDLAELDAALAGQALSTEQATVDDSLTIEAPASADVAALDEAASALLADVAASGPAEIAGPATVENAPATAEDAEEIAALEALLARTAVESATPAPVAPPIDEQAAPAMEAVPAEAMASAFEVEAPADMVAPAAAREAVAPEAVAPEAFTPEAFTPEAVTQEAFAPEAVAQEAITPEAAAQDVAASEALALAEAAEPDDPDAFRLEPQSILALQAQPTEEELAELEAEEQAAIAAALRGTVELPLITICDAWTEPEPVLEPELEPVLEPVLEAVPIAAVAAAAAAPAVSAQPPSSLVALERLLRKVQARRQLLAESMA